MLRMPEVRASRWTRSASGSIGTFTRMPLTFTILSKASMMATTSAKAMRGKAKEKVTSTRATGTMMALAIISATKAGGDRRGHLQVNALRHLRRRK